jgi:glutamate-1-semialdehyde 2,1-aminomutase
MDQLSPDGPVYQAGTLSGNPLSVAAGLATLREISKPGFYDRLEKQSQRWEADLHAALNRLPLFWRINRVGSMLTVFFSERTVRDYASAVTCDTLGYGRFFQACLKEGLYLAPSQFEAGFLSIAHDAPVLERVAEKMEKVADSLRPQ